MINLILEQRAVEVALVVAVAVVVVVGVVAVVVVVVVGVVAVVEAEAVAAAVGVVAGAFEVLLVRQHSHYRICTLGARRPEACWHSGRCFVPDFDCWMHRLRDLD